MFSRTLVQLDKNEKYVWTVWFDFLEFFSVLSSFFFQQQYSLWSLTLPLQCVRKILFPACLFSSIFLSYVSRSLWSHLKVKIKQTQGNTGQTAGKSIHKIRGMILKSEDGNCKKSSHYCSNDHDLLVQLQ